MTLNKINKNMIDPDFVKQVNDTTEQLADTAKQTDLNTTNGALSLKADKTEVNNLASDKADKTYVDTSLSTLDTKINSQASGSPKGVYATVTALQTAFPTGNTNIYVVTTDGNWYYWNGSVWMAGGIYQSSNWLNALTTQNQVWGV